MRLTTKLHQLVGVSISDQNSTQHLYGLERQPKETLDMKLCAGMCRGCIAVKQGSVLKTGGREVSYAHHFNPSQEELEALVLLE